MTHSLRFLLLVTAILPAAIAAGDPPTASAPPHLVIVMAEREYQTKQTLPKFAAAHLESDFRVSLVHADGTDRNQIPGLEKLADADVALISVRRRTPSMDQLRHVRDFVAAGKSVVGIRTANHAFSLRRGKPPAGHDHWPQWDAQIFGGNYSGHHSGEGKSVVSIVATADQHPILSGMTGEPFRQAGTLYRVSPLADGATPLLIAAQPGHDEEPIAWTFERKDGGKSFYTSLGHPGDFENDDFVQMLGNAICWAANLPIGHRSAVTPASTENQ